MFSSTQPVSFEYFADHLASQAARSLRRGDQGEIAAIVKPTQLLQAIIVDPARHVIEGVPQQMHVAALIGRLRQSLAQGGSEASVVISHYEFDAVETTRLEPQQEIPPARSALPVGELDRQNLAPAVPVDADRDQHRLAGDHAGFA